MTSGSQRVKQFYHHLKIFCSFNSLVQAILIMGGQWMGRVNENLDDLEEDIKSLEIKEDDMESLRDSEQKHKVR